MLFEVQYKAHGYFRYFLRFFLFHHLSFQKTEWAYSCLPSKDSYIIHYIHSKHGFIHGHSIQYKMLLVHLHVYRSINLKAIKLFENSDLTSPGFVLAPLAVGQRAYVIARCLSVRPCINFFFKIFFSETTIGF